MAEINKSDAQVNTPKAEINISMGASDKCIGPPMGQNQMSSAPLNLSKTPVESPKTPVELSKAPLDLSKVPIESPQVPIDLSKVSKELPKEPMKFLNVADTILGGDKTSNASIHADKIEAPKDAMDLTKALSNKHENGINLTNNKRMN